MGAGFAAGRVRWASKADGKAKMVSAAIGRAKDIIRINPPYPALLNAAHNVPQSRGNVNICERRADAGFLGVSAKVSGQKINPRASMGAGVYLFS